jgi:hypothetical protein
MPHDLSPALCALNPLKLKSNILRLLFSFIDFLAVADAKHNNIAALYVEDHTIIADAETVAAEFRVSQPFGYWSGLFLKRRRVVPIRFLTPESSLSMSLTAFCVYTSRYFNARIPHHAF